MHAAYVQMTLLFINVNDLAWIWLAIICDNHVLIQIISAVQISNLFQLSTLFSVFPSSPFFFQILFIL